MEAFVTYRKRLETPDLVEGAPLDMEWVGFSRFIDVLAASKLGRFLLRGNEASLHPEFGKMIETALKRQIVPIVETCGIILDDAMEVIASKSVPVVLRVYPDHVYGKDEQETVRQTMRRLRERQDNRLGLLAICDDPTKPPEFPFELLREFPLQELTFRVLQVDSIPDLRQLTEWLTPKLAEMRVRGVQTLIDCGIPPCAYSDETYGRLFKHGVRQGACDPKPGVRPDLRVYHCHRMHDTPGCTLHRFKRVSEIIDYFYRRHNSLQWDLRFYPDCVRCPSLETRTCGGVCMAIKHATLSAELARKKELVASQENLDALVDTGFLCFELSHYAEAAEYLREARRVEPARGDIHLLLARVLWETGEHKEAEEEFHKAARLSQDARPILAELANRLETNGNLFKSRRLIEDIRRMPEPSSEKS